MKEDIRSKIQRHEQHPVIIEKNKHVTTALNASVNIHKFSLAKSLSPLTLLTKTLKTLGHLLVDDEG